ncbi:MAG: hypothetical protein Q8S84_04130 [bacterium]|nr:hypothetical protein [bacterium]MDP3380692.1 hypothetical protein [bacterium]
MYIHKAPHAHFQEHHIELTEAGQYEGTHKGQTLCQVFIENIGNHSSTFNQSHIVLHIKIGSDHGANGAQFNGEAKQDSLPNQQFNHCTILSTESNAESTFAHIHHKSTVILQSILKLSSSFGIQS